MTPTKQTVLCIDEFDALLNSTALDTPLPEVLSVNDNGAVARDLAVRGLVVFPILKRAGGDWSPITGWQAKASADPATVREWWKLYPDARVGLLAGVANGVSVLDLDTKNGKDGIQSLATLGFADLVALSPVRVRTPSGGWHLYFRYEPLLKNSAGKIGVGIDVKTAGGYVIAPGSYKDGKRYHVEGAPLGSIALPSFPASLIPAVEPQHDPVEVLTEPSQALRDWAAEKVADRALEVTQAEDGTRNSTLNNAAMYVGGLAAHGLVTEDEARAALRAAASQVGIKTPEFRSTFRSGWKAGLKKPVFLGMATDGAEFDDLDDDDDFDALMRVAPPPIAADDWDGGSGDAAAKIDPVTVRLNKRHAVVAVRGRTLVTTERVDGTIDFGTIRDIHTFYENDRVAFSDGKKETASIRWLRNPARRSYQNGVTFAPDGCEDGTLNLWRGWAVEPDVNASCDLFLHHVRTVICRGNAEHADYVLGWLAHMVQHPGEKPGVGLVLKGGKGAGKDTVAEYVARMIGRRHAPTVAESDHIVGKFNARLENALLLHVQEGSWAGDRKAEGVLKYLVTSDRIEIERKGIDSINLPSVLRLFISANADWVVPASPDERRWAVFEVSDQRRGDEVYFVALRAELNGSGPAALLHYLREYDLSRFNVRKAPDTEGLRNQKIASLRNVELWWFEKLNRGSSFASGTLEGNDWTTTPDTVDRDTLRGNYVEWMKGRRYDGEPLEERYFGRRMRDMLPEMENHRPSGKHGAPRRRQYRLPELGVCRDAYQRWLGSPVDWDAVS